MESLFEMYLDRTRQPVPKDKESLRKVVERMGNIGLIDSQECENILKSEYRQEKLIEELNKK
jgi:hypothetical protein